MNTQIRVDPKYSLPVVGAVRAEDTDAVEALAPNGANHPFGAGILPWTRGPGAPCDTQPGSPKLSQILDWSAGLPRVHLWQEQFPTTAEHLW